MATRYNYTGQLVTDGLVLNLDAAKRDSYPGSGTTWYDLSGNGNNGTLTNGPTYTGVSKDAAIVFDGVDDYVSVPDDSTLNFTTDLTITLTFALDNTSTANQTLVGKQEGGAYGIELNTSFFPNAIGGLFYINGGYRLVSDSISNYSNGTWANIAITYDGTTLRYYRNGTQVSTTTYTGSVTTTNQPFLIGANPGNTNIYFLDGKVAEVKLYNKALSSQEVLQNYNAIKTRFGL